MVQGPRPESSAPESELLVVGKRFNVERRAVPRRGGGFELREVVVHPGSVIILPRLDDGRLVLIRNQRFTARRTLWELPAGTRERDEPPEACAARELEEETGFRAARLTPLFDFYVAPGITDERMHAFVAEGLVERAQNLDDIEHIEVHCLDEAEVMRMVRAREIEDAKTIATLLFWAATR